MNRPTTLRIRAAALLLAVFTMPAFSQPSPDSAMSYLQSLADPNLFAGRKTALAGGDSSQSWIARHYQRWGLTPLINGNFLVPFPMLATREVRAEVTMQDPRYGEVRLRLGEDFTACTNSGSAKLTAPVSLVGHGISKPEKGWDDYGDEDVSGRILIIFRGAPNSSEDWTNENQRTYLLNEAVRRGAVAVFFYQEPWPVNGAAIQKNAYSATVPSGYIGDSALRMLLFDSGESVDHYKETLKSEPHALNLERTMSLDFLIEPIENAVGYNVAAFVPGTDPKLKDEAIVIGAHGDHIGKNALGQVYPGADDNGSGTCAVMELARYYVAHPQKRTLVFCDFGGEEQGLLGSKALVLMLPDRYSYVTMLNMDMVGRGDGQIGFGGGDQLGEIWDPWFDSLPDSVRKLYRAGRAWGGDASDHASFRNAGIPAFTLWSMGAHPFYHRPDDNFASIQPKAIEGTLRTVSAWVDQLANVDQPLADRHLASRTIWHRGTPFVEAKTCSSIDSDLEAAKARAERGIMGSLLKFAYPAADGQEAFLDNLETLKTAASDRDDILWGKSLKDVTANARRALGTVEAELDGDPLVPADTLRVLEWADAGLAALSFSDPPEWLEGETLSDAEQALVRALKARDVTILWPLDGWQEAPAFLSAAGPMVTLSSNFKQFAKTSDAELDRIDSTGAKFVVTLKKSEMKKALKQADRFARYKVQVQPGDVGYEDALEWVQAGREHGISDDELVDWIAGHMRLW